jgi:hypothetical protein
MGKPVTVRLYRLPTEHFLVPLLVDLAAFVVFFGAWRLGFGLPDGPVALLPIAALLGAVHLAQLYWLTVVRFDDEAITIVRLWRRTRIEWSRVSGLMYSWQPGWRPYVYRLHLVPKGAEPPFGRHLSDAELERYATGPVIMTLSDPNPESGSDTRSGRCRDTVFAELTRHGFPPPEPVVLRFRSPDFTPEQARLAEAEDLIRSRGDEPEEHQV